MMDLPNFIIYVFGPGQVGFGLVIFLLIVFVGGFWNLFALAWGHQTISISNSLLETLAFLVAMCYVGYWFYNYIKPAFG